MKKYVMTLLALVFGLGMVNANPVTSSQAKYVGQQFVQANFELTRQSSDLSLVYTGTSFRGETCLMWVTKVSSSFQLMTISVPFWVIRKKAFSQSTICLMV